MNKSIIVMALLLSGCTTVKVNVDPVDPTIRECIARGECVYV